MKIGVMQPYIFPYIGYFQLINAVDKFIIYDNIKFTKKGWINRNRILMNGKEDYITLPIKKDSDFLNVDERFLADIFEDEKIKLLRKIKDAYKKAPYFTDTYALIESIITYQEKNLFRFIYNSLKELCNYLEIQTEFIISSTVDVDHELKAESKVIALCNAVGATSYINAIGGVELYSKDTFEFNNIELKFIKPESIVYSQFNNPFVPWLSIIDIMMFNSKATIKEFLNLYNLV
jgi:hypothetical protein